jgi:uncharacterized circularly permuted ATP-grasp superfamily protein
MNFRGISKRGMFEGYKTEGFFDEMFDADGSVRPHYLKLAEALQSIPGTEFELKRKAADMEFLRKGITFTVYGDKQGTERIFPFDLVPRIIPKNEWDRIEAGLVQRITALNLFLHDVYHDQRIVKENVIPADYVLSARHFRREFMHFNCRKTSISTSAERI